MRLSILALFALLVLVAESARVRVRRLDSPWPYRLQQRSYVSMARPVYQNRPLRPFPRTFRALSFSNGPAVVLLKNESSVEYETVDTGSDGDESYIEMASSISAPSNIVPQDSVKSKPNSKTNKNKVQIQSNQDQDLKVQFSDVRPIYVKPPSDFTPVIYPNRRLDGVRSTARGSILLPSLAAPSPPYPYGIPHGLSAWTLGGSRSVQRGSYWESLGSDEALNLTPVYSVSSYPASRTIRRKAVKPAASSPVASWLVYPGSRINNGYQAPATFTQTLPLPVAYKPLPSGSTSSKRFAAPAAYRPPLSPPKRKPTAPNYSKTAAKSPSDSKSTGIRTKLPVGLTSWMFGGVRDLTGKHWNMPDLLVDKVNVVPVARDPHANKRDFFDGKELMMSGDVETFEPKEARPTFAGEVDESSAATNDAPVYTNVFFDDEPDNFNSVSA